MDTATPLRFASLNQQASYYLHCFLKKKFKNLEISRRGGIIASNIKVLNQTFKNTVTLNSSATTTIGSQSGAGGQTSSGQSTGSGGGWNFNYSSSSGVVINSSVNYSLNTQAEETLGTVDFEYCSGLNDNGGNVGVFPLTTCNPFNSGNPDYNCYISTPTNGNWNMMVTGAEELSSGSITLKTSIEHN